MKARTGIFFSSANWRMRRKIRCDCAGEPPGELMISATARALRVEKARSSERATVESISPGRSGVTTPMTPDSRTTGTTGISARKRAGTSERRRARILAEDILALFCFGGKVYGPVTQSWVAGVKAATQINLCPRKRHELPLYSALE